MSLGRLTRVVLALGVALSLFGTSLPVGPARAATTVALSGTVLDANGSPLSGVTVSVYNQGTATALTLEATVTTGADGKFSVNVGTNCFYAVVASKPSVATLADDLRYVPVFGSAVTGQDLRLRTANVAGKVVHEDQSAAQNAVVKMTSTEYVPDGGDFAVFARPDGTFKMHVPVGSYWGRADPMHSNPLKESSSLSTPVMITDDGGDLTVVDDLAFVLRLPTLFGRLYIEGTETPVARAYVSFYDEAQQETSTVTASDGTFFAALSDGKYQVRTYVEPSVLSPSVVLNDWMSDWTFVAGSSEANPLRFDVKTPNFKGSIIAASDGASLPGSSLFIESLGEIPSYPRGSVGGDGRFGYQLEPGDYMVAAVPSVENPGGLASKVEYLTIGESGVLNRTFALSGATRPSFSMSRLAESVPDPCGDDQEGSTYEQKVLQMDSDGSRALVDICSTDNPSLSRIALVDTASEAVLHVYPAATSMATMSRDGKVVVWAQPPTDSWSSDYSLVVARAPSWNTASTTVGLPSYGYGLLRPALSGDGSKIALQTKSVDGDAVVAVCDVLDDGTVDCEEATTIAVGDTEVDHLRLSADGATLSLLRKETYASWRALVYSLVDGTWVEGLSERSANAPPALSDDGSRIVWMTPGGTAFGESSRTSDPAKPWSDTNVITPIDSKRLYGQPGGYDGFELSGDGKVLLFISRVRDLVYNVLMEGYPLVKRYTSAQLWRTRLDGPGEAELVSVDAGTKFPLEGYMGFYGDILSLAASREGDRFAIGATVPVDMTGFLLGTRLHFGVAQNQQVYEFDDKASISAVRGSQTVILSWPAASGRNVRYRVSRTPANGTSAVVTSNTTLTVSGLNPATSYRFTVDALAPDDSVGDSISATVTTTAARTRSLTAAAGDGGTMQFSWDPEPVASSCVVRGTPVTAGLAPVSKVAEGSTATVTGLASGSTWKFQVFCTIDGKESSVTDELRVTVRTMSVESVTWSAPKVGRLASRDGSLRITMKAEAGRTGSATVNRTLSDGTSDPATVSLSEESPGTYVGSLALAGTGKVNGVVGRLADGDSNIVSLASQLAGVSVEGVLELDVSGPAQVGWDVVVKSEDGSLVRVQPITTAGPQKVTMGGLRQASKVTATVRTQGGIEISSVDVPDIEAGEKVAAAITVVPLVDVSFLVTFAGGAPVASMRLDVAVGGKIWQLDTNSEGRATVGGVHAGREVAVVARPANPFAVTVATVAPFTVAETDMEVEIDVTRREASSLGGSVRREDGSALGYASVLVAQRLGDLVRQVTTRTDYLGAYEVSDLYAGLPTTATVTPVQTIPATKDLTPVAGANVVDFTIDAPTIYMVPVKLYSSGSPTSLALDWRTAVHFRMSASVGIRPISPYTLVTDLPEGTQGGILPVPGAEGETLRICFDGMEAGDGSGCGSVVLPPESSAVPELEVFLSGVVNVQATVRNKEGDLYAGDLAVRISEPDGRTVWSGWVDGPRIEIPVTATGPLRLTVTPTAASLLGYSAATSFTITGGVGPTLTLPEDLVLDKPTRFAPPRNTLVADRSTVSPGGYVEFRANWTNEGSDLDKAVARVSVPGGSKLNTRSVMLGTVPVAPGTIVLDDQGDSGIVAKIPLGDIKRGDSGVLRWRLVVDEATTATALVGGIEIGSGSSFDSLPDIAVPIAGVVLNVPAEPSSRRFAASGRAPAGATVEIFAEGAVVGAAVATNNGTWSTTVELPERPDGFTYTLVARAKKDSVTLESSKETATIDSKTVKTTAVCVRQQDPQRSDGRRTCFDPSIGVATFPFVYVPGQTLQVEVFTETPDRVDAVKVWVGDLSETAARRAVAAPPLLGLPIGTTREAFVADFTNTVVRGEIAVEVSARPVRPTPPARPSEEEAVRYLDGPFVDGTVTSISDIVETPSGGGFTATIDLPSTPNPTDSEIEMNFTAVEDGPTESELNEMLSTGSWGWDFAMGTPTVATMPDGTKRTSQTVTFKMLVKDIPGISTKPSAGLDRIRPLGAGVSPVIIEALVEALLASLKAFVLKAVEVTFNLGTTADSGYKAATANTKYSAIGALADLVSPCMSAEKQQAYFKRIDNLLSMAAFSDVAGATIAILGLLAAPATFGWGTVALWSLGFYADYLIGQDFDRQTAAMKAEIEKDNALAEQSPGCRKKPKDGPDGKRGKHGKTGAAGSGRTAVAKPAWIYDPSGYTYEGSTAQRVTGVTATLLRAPDVGENEPCPEAAAWTVVDMTPYGQVNPLITDEDGRYAWDVPEGCWKVQFTKEGYVTAFSAALKVLPPHLDVNIEMIPVSAPSVVSATLKDGAVEVLFDRLMSVGSTSDALSLTLTSNGEEVGAAVSAVDETTSPLGRALAKKFRIVPTTALAPGGSYTVVVSTDAADYASKTMVDPASFALNVPTTTTTSTTSTTVPRSTTTTTVPKPTTTTTVPKPTTTTSPATTVPKPATPPGSYKVNKSATRTAILGLAKMKAPSGSKVSMAVAKSSSKICRVSGTSVRMLKPGTCRLTVTVAPKKGKATRKTVSLKIVK